MCRRSLISELSLSLRQPPCPQPRSLVPTDSFVALDGRGSGASQQNLAGTVGTASGEGTADVGY